MTDAAAFAKAWREVRPHVLVSIPDALFSAFGAKDHLPSQLAIVCKAFEENLRATAQVGTLPMMLVTKLLIKHRLDQLYASEQIRKLSLDSPGDPISDEQLSEARRVAVARMDVEIGSTGALERYRDAAIVELHYQLSEEEFGRSSQDLLRQLLVMIWGAFEVLVNDTIRATVNTRPDIATALANSTYFKNVGRQALLDMLSRHDFNLAGRIGDTLLDAISLDSLEKIRDASATVFGSSGLDRLLSSQELWLIAQRRHLIVHRRSRIDATYLLRTSDALPLDERLILSAGYVVSSLELVRDAGLAMLEAAASSFRGR